jgi:NCAIR mutase (PurE)-related protein
MQRMRILLERPDSVEPADVTKQYREVKLRFDQTATKLTAEDRGRSSWSHLSKAMDQLNQVQRGLELENDYSRAVENGLPPVASGPNQIKESTEQNIRYLHATTAAIVLAHKLPEMMTVARDEIARAETDLQGRQ